LYLSTNLYCRLYSWNNICGWVSSLIICSMLTTMRETQVPFTVTYNSYKDVSYMHKQGRNRVKSVTDLVPSSSPSPIAMAVDRKTTVAGIYRGSGGCRTAGVLGWMTGKRSRSMGQSATRCHRMPPYTPSSGKLSANNIICPPRP